MWLPREWRREGDGPESGIGRCKLLHSEWVSNKILLYSTVNYIQSLGINYNGKGYFKKEYINVYLYKSLCCMTEIGTTL